MRKLFKKATSALLAFTILPQVAAIGIDKNIKNIKANAATSTQTYTIYGDLNGDKVIDSFDLVQMRRDIQNEQASTSSDLNRDEFVDEDDLIELQEYSLKYGNTKTQRDDNYNYYDKTAEKDNYKINWNEKFAK